MRYPQKLIQDCRAYLKIQNQIISEETTEQYLDSLADLYRCLKKSTKQGLREDTIESS